MTGNQIKRLTNDANDDMPLVVAGVGLTIKTNVAVIVMLGHGSRFLKTDKDASKSNAAS
jgi:hypothetical protein